MKKEEVKVGSIYTAKISGAVVPVRIVQEKWKGEKHTGWTGVNTKTNRPVNIKSAAKLREEVGAAADHNEQGDEPPPAAPGALPLPGESAGADAVAAVAGPDGGAAANGAAKGRKAKGGGKTPKAAKQPKAPKEAKPKKLSGLDAAAAVLKKAGKAMNFKDITDGALALGWKTSGKTPAATLYAAAIREIAAKGKQARFRKTERGMFEHTGVDGKGE